MMFARGRAWVNPARHRLPLIALIDVVLFLLLYFMIAGSLAADEAELSSTLRSERAGGGRAADLQPQVILVDVTPDRQVVYRLGERVLKDRPALASLLRQLPKEGGVFIKANGAAPVGATAGALQACKDAGFTRITYVPTP